MSLELSIWAWLSFGSCVVLWALSALFAGSYGEPSGWEWQRIPLSFFGFAWLGFFGDYIFRFLALVADAELFRATQYPFWLMPEETIPKAWLFVGIYWGVFCLGYGMVEKAIKGKISGLLTRLNFLQLKSAIQVVDMLALATLSREYSSTVLRRRSPGAYRLPWGLSAIYGCCRPP